MAYVFQNDLLLLNYFSLNELVQFYEILWLQNLLKHCVEKANIFLWHVLFNEIFKSVQVILLG